MKQSDLNKLIDRIDAKEAQIGLDLLRTKEVVNPAFEVVRAEMKGKKAALKEVLNELRGDVSCLGLL